MELQKKNMMTVLEDLSLEINEEKRMTETADLPRRHMFQSSFHLLLQMLELLDVQALKIFSHIVPK